MSQLLTIIPKDDEILYAMLPHSEQRELDKILSWLPAITANKSTLAACRDAAPRIGMTTKQLYSRVCNYLNCSDWKCLVNKSRAGAAFWQKADLVGLPARFQSFYRGLCEKHQRTDRGGYLELKQIWLTHYDAEGRRHDVIPGYAEWPMATACQHPRGWSERNLSRYAPDYYDSAAARIGPFAAGAYRPKVRTKRDATLLFGEIVEFDDHEYNFKVHFPGQVKAMRPRGFGAAEALSAFITPFFKMTLWDEEEEKKKTLREMDFRWFALYWLSTIGYRTDEAGTELRGELGLSVFRESFAEAIRAATGGKVTCPQPGAMNKPAHSGQYAPRGKSSFKRKPLIEGWWSYVDNYFDRLPGQVGLDRLTAPEEMHGREVLLQSVLKAAATLPPDRAAQLRIPFMNWSEFMQPSLEIYQALNGNTEHDIQGWTELGFHATEWRLAEEMPWRPQQQLLAMPEENRAAVMAVLQASSGVLTRARNMSRAEVFATKHAEALRRGEMERLSPWKWGSLMGLEASHAVTVNKESKFCVSTRELGPTPVEYLASINGQHLEVGAKYRAFINPCQPEKMLLCKLDGAAVGLCELWERPAKNDAPGIARMAGKQAHWEAQRRAGLNERHADRAAEIAHMEAHNAALISPVDAKAARIDRKLDREARKETDDFSALGDASPAKRETGEGLTMEELSQI